MDGASPLDLGRCFWRNAIGISVSEFCWGLGLPLILESTFVTVFLTSVGASNSQIGLTGTVFNVSFAVVPLFAAYWTSRMPYKRGPTIWVQVVPSICIMMLGGWYLTFGVTGSAYTVFLLFFALFAVGLSAAVPVWQNYVVKIFTPDESVRGVSMMMVAQNAGKLLSGTILAVAVASAGMSASSGGIVFFLTGCAFLAGSFLYFLTKENRDDVDKVAVESPLRYFRHHLGHFLSNRSVLLFLLQDVEFYAVMVAITFYARYAIEWRSVSMAEATGAFIIFLFAGAICANVLLGFVWKARLKARYWAIKASSILALALLLFLREKSLFYAASFMLGFSRSGRVQLYGPVVKRLSGLQDASPYYAIAPLLMLPVSSGLPLLMGLLLDELAAWQSGAYRLVFACLLGVTLLSLVPFLKLRLSEGPEGGHISPEIEG